MGVGATCSSRYSMRATALGGRAVAALELERQRPQLKLLAHQQVQVDQVLDQRNPLPQQQAVDREVVDGRLRRGRVLVDGEVYGHGIDAIVSQVGRCIGAQVGAMPVEHGAAGLVFGPRSEQHGNLAGQRVGNSTSGLNLFDG